jgi:hypothetical protein
MGGLLSKEIEIAEEMSGLNEGVLRFRARNSKSPLP